MHYWRQQHLVHLYNLAPFGNDAAFDVAVHSTRKWLDPFREVYRRRAPGRWRCGRRRQGLGQQLGCGHRRCRKKLFLTCDIIHMDLRRHLEQGSFLRARIPCTALVLFIGKT